MSTCCYFQPMVQPGDVIENPVTGETMTFLRTSAQTGGALAQMELALAPTAHLAAEHIHQRQEERFEVIEGLVRLRWAGQESLAGPGETVVVPAGSPHSWAPEGDAGARVRLTFTPGAGIEEFFDEFFRLGREGRTNAKGLPSPFVAARLGLAHEMFFAGPPVPLQRALFRFVAGVGKVIGRD